MAPSTYAVVDLSPFSAAAGSHEEKDEVIKRMSESLAEYGFFVAVNHGIPPATMDDALKTAVEFFSRPSEEKLKWGPRPDAPHSAGYVKQPDDSPNRNEYLMTYVPGTPSNVIPTDPPHFSEMMSGMWGQFHKTANLMQTLFTEALGLPAGTLQTYNDDRNSDLLLAFHYLPATEKSIGVNAHKNTSLFTMVFTDEVEGLQFLKDDKWITVTPIPNSLIVNAGDILQVLSNDKMKSPMHRNMLQVGRDRFSFIMAYMVGPEKVVEPFKEAIRETGEAPKYRGFVFKDYMEVKEASHRNPPANLEEAVSIRRYAIRPSEE